MNPDYEVWWDGSHGNRDSDLLCCPKVPEKKPPPKLTAATQIGRGASQLRIALDLEGGPLRLEDRNSRALADAAYDAVCACLRQRPCDARELQAVTGLTMRAITTALQRLRRSRQLATSRGKVARRKGTPATVLYLLRPAA